MIRGACIFVLGGLAACASPSAPAVEQRIIRAEAYIEADYDVVWDRFTTVEGYADWASTPCLAFPTRPGDPVLWGTETPVYRGILERIEHGRGLTHTLQFVGFGFEEVPTPVEIGIVQYGETVLVSIRQDCSGAPRTFEMISPVGWTKSLSRLKTLLETGAPMPWPAEGAPVPSSLSSTAQS